MAEQEELGRGGLGAPEDVTGASAHDTPPDAARADDVPDYGAADASDRVEEEAPDEDAIPTSRPGKLRFPRVEATAPSPRPPAVRRPDGRAAQDRGRMLSLVHDRLIEAMDLRRLDLDALGSQQLREKTERTILQIVGSARAAATMCSTL